MTWSKRGLLLWFSSILLATLLSGCILVSQPLETAEPDISTSPVTEPTLESTVASEPIDLNVVCTPQGNNAYRFTWNEIPGERYAIYMSADDGYTWEMVGAVGQEAENSYTTDYLPPFETYIFWIVGIDTGLNWSCVLETEQRAVYSTIWPLVNLEVYADESCTEIIGTAKAGTAFCVLSETEQLFTILFDGKLGYISSNYCMINLPEYIGDICSYDITNSYSSLYLVHEFGLHAISGTVVCGYENVAQSDGTYLAPLLYPTAKKLIVAAKKALEQGYRLKIYDSFRPRKATKAVYTLVKEQLDIILPDETFYGQPVGAYAELTYRLLMTDNNRYRLANFLATSVSNHNRGIAVDLTLETLDGVELTMQSAMHDLSWYSELGRNNDEANFLQEIMVSSGFGTISSEWWHFQDDEIRSSLERSYLSSGVSAQCWVKDAIGWCYRLANGTFVSDCAYVIDGVEYIFDESGHVVDQ